jgi:alpha-tubulin suppressor-like RCC1 family protein
MYVSFHSLFKDVGRIGDGTFTNRNTPVPIAGDNTNNYDICSGDHTLILKKNGSVYGFGLNNV